MPALQEWQREALADAEAEARGELPPIGVRQFVSRSKGRRRLANGTVKRRPRRAPREVVLVGWLGTWRVYDADWGDVDMWADEAFPGDPEAARSAMAAIERRLDEKKAGAA